MRKLIFACCLSTALLAQNISNIFDPFYYYFLSLPEWQSDTCPASIQSIPKFVVPANLMCADNEPNCYEPSSRWDVGIAVMNGPFKATKSYFKYSGKTELAALSGTANTMSDFVLLWLREKISFKESSIFASRIIREGLRAARGPSLISTGSYEDLTAENIAQSIQVPFDSNAAKALLKIPLLFEKNLDWGDNSTQTWVWLESSIPGTLLSLSEHYARYYRMNTLRPIVGGGLVVLEAVSFYSLCTKNTESLIESKEETYKSIRQLLRIILHGLEQASLFSQRHAEGSAKLQIFTYLTMFEHLFVSVMDAVYYSWYLQPTRTHLSDV
ncbi:MAG: hypothetical protein WCK49_02940 [Myxococcaceae bacterium]